jgi:CRP-like cAMP-binding protein
MMKTPLRVDAEALAYPRLIIEKGEAIIALGAATDQAYFLLDGSARAHHPIVNEGEIEAGHFLSFVSFLALENYEADVLATSRCEVLVLPRELVERCWQNEDKTSWVFACSVASDTLKKKMMPDMVVA